MTKSTRGRSWIKPFLSVSIDIKVDRLGVKKVDDWKMLKIRAIIPDTR